MHERLFSAAWDSLSPKEQEAFEAWSKAVFKANEAQKRFMHIYLSKELKASSDKDLDAAVLDQADDFKSLKKKLLIEFVTTLTGCDHCFKNGKIDLQCYMDCIHQK
ncbi:MAG: hypothetical protein RID09_07480 [Coleofasciculus sp. G1-WW12-02]|uniref:hypothetical protein n=1 Tax=Coleofasciculus sp. G1-WW12-02 TaxID=3068483 RepID=UPI0032FD11DB